MINNKYGHLSKEELIALLSERDDTRKLGLVWERNTIEHEKALNGDFVTLDFLETNSFGGKPYENLVIEGDNFDTLRYLNITHKGKVKCIYIDPPYNTGNKDFIYNDQYIDSEDGWKHSKWIEFMYQRLDLAKDLLSEDGVIFVSIDDHEYANLKLLMDRIFPNMYVGSFVWKRRTGSNDEKEWYLSVDHEYVLCYANPNFFFGGLDKGDSAYKNPDDDPRGPWKKADLSKASSYYQRPNTYYHICDQENDIWYPCSMDRVWAFATQGNLKENQQTRSDTIEKLLEDNRIIFPTEKTFVIFDSIEELTTAINNKENMPSVLNTAMPDLAFFVGKKIGFGRPMQKKFLSDIKKSTKPLSTWIIPTSEKSIDDENVEFIQSGMTTDGTKVLKQVMGYKAFDHPKPLNLIEALINQATDKDNEDIVLDFFAGSGTTAHAVLNLNAQDNGNRRFIMLSSTEATKDIPDRNICENVTRQRIQNVICGYSYQSKSNVIHVPGTGGNFAYLKAIRIPQETIHMDIKHDQIWIALQLFHTKEIMPYTNHDYELLELSYNKLIYVPKLTTSVLDHLQAEVGKSGKSCLIYSWEAGLLKQRISAEHVEIEKIPDYLIEKFGRIS